MIFNSKHKNIEFDKTLWLEDREKRKYMVSSIINNNLIIGLTKKEIIDLLGFEFNDIHSNTWSYYIGTKNILFTSKCYLYVYFNNSNKVFKILKK